MFVFIKIFVHTHYKSRLVFLQAFDNVIAYGVYRVFNYLRKRRWFEC